MASSLPPQQLTHCFISNHQLFKGFRHGCSTSSPSLCYTESNNRNRSVRAAVAAVDTVNPSSFPIYQEPLQLENSPSSDLEPVDPDFYKIGYVRSVRAYGVEFKEGPDGFGVYASRDVEPLRRARVIMEIPLELMLTISQKLPWMFFPDIIPVGHPIFDIINSTDPEADADLRLACLLLYSFDREDNFWQLYSDLLSSAEESPSMLLASEEELLSYRTKVLLQLLENSNREL